MLVYPLAGCPRSPVQVGLALVVPKISRLLSQAIQVGGCALGRPRMTKLSSISLTERILGAKNIKGLVPKISKSTMTKII